MSTSAYSIVMHLSELFLQCIFMLRNIPPQLSKQPFSDVFPAGKDCPL